MRREAVIIECGIDTLGLPEGYAPLLETVCQMYAAAQWLELEKPLAQEEAE